MVLNNYRTGDYSAHLYHTVNSGKTWLRIIDDKDVWGYVICFVQDPVEPRLMFAGTEYGLYVSFDSGATWNKWTTGYPTVSTYDMAIHPRESDLVIGTFGRAIWVIDNIIPLREVARKGASLLNEKVVAFNSPAAIMASAKNLPGYYYRGDALYEGENRPLAALLNCYVSEDKAEKLKVEITDNEGTVIRNLEADVKKGFNRITWRFEKNASPTAGQIERGPQQSDEMSERMRFFRNQGGGVLPGDYNVKMSYNGASSVSAIKVMSDPRMPQPDIASMKANHKRADETGSKIKELNALYQKFHDLNAILSKADELTRKNQEFADAVKDIHGKFREIYSSTDRKLTSRPDGLFAKINGYRVLLTATGPLSETEEKSVSDVNKALEEATILINGFIARDWPEYEKKMADRKIPAGILLK